MLKRIPLNFTYIRLKTNDSEMVGQISELKTDKKIETLLLMAKTTNIEKFVLQVLSVNVFNFKQIIEAIVL